MTASLTVLTWNLWFGHFERKHRLDAALDVVRSERPHVIAFQEVLPETLAQIRATRWIADEFFIPDSIAASPGGRYGTVLLSRVEPVAVHVIGLPSAMARCLVTVDLDLAGHALRVAGVHLESKSSTSVRIDQIRQVRPLLAEADTAVLMGDMNFDDGDAEETELAADAQDLWSHLRPDERGATRDTTSNLMAALHSATTKVRRIDRIYLVDRQARWQPQSIRMIGTEPIGGDSTVFPSDHFGLVADLRPK